MNAEEAKSKISDKLSSIFPGHHIGFSFDPDDDGIVYVRVYGVLDDDVNDSKQLVWDLIDSLGVVDDVEFVPSIISMTNTRLYHSELLPAKNDFDNALPDSFFPLLESSGSVALPSPSHSCSQPLQRWHGLHDASFLNQIDEDPHERNDFKIAA